MVPDNDIQRGDPTRPGDGHGSDRLPDATRPERRGFRIRIDRAEYVVRAERLSGAELRQVPPTPIPPDRDLYLVVPGHDDRKIGDDDSVEMRNGLRFFTAPSTINPGVRPDSDPPTLGAP